jgi:cell division protein FtsI/penicillin-binding protein 2
VSPLKRDSRSVDRDIRKRLVVLTVIMLFASVVMTYRVLSLQTWKRSGYLAESIDQRTRVNTVRASRGVIFDRSGNELALSVPTNTLWADPRSIVDPTGTARALAGMLGLDPTAEAALVERLSQSTAKFTYVARELPKEVTRAVLDLGLPGIYSYVEPARVVESGAAEPVIGKTDPDGLGTSGIELKYNDVLTGTDGTRVRQVDNGGRSIAGEGSTTVQPVPGDDLVLTLDRAIQYQMDAAVLSRVMQLNARGGTAIAMDSRTGDILAMTNVKRRADGTVGIADANYAVVESYEPGSVAKVFSISTAINEGNVTPDSVLTVPGIVTIDDFPIRDAWPHGPLEMNVRTIISESSNIGTMMVADAVGFTKIHDYLAKFGFGSRTALDYPGESRGILKSVKKTYGTERSTVSYGYGFAATPLQLVSAVNVIANGGKYVSPRLVSATIDRDGHRHTAPDSGQHDVLSPATAATMTDMMRDVVCTGTGERAKVKGMEIAGKTGTGYKVQSNGTYVTDAGGRRYFASFVGFFPAAAPRVTILVSIDEPSSGTIDRFGGTAAAPVFAQLVPTVMSELGIEPTGSGTGCAGRVGADVGH